LLRDFFDLGRRGSLRRDLSVGIPLPIDVGCRCNPPDDNAFGSELGHRANDVPSERAVGAPAKSTFVLDGSPADERSLENFPDQGTIVGVYGFEERLRRRAIELDARIFTPGAIAEVGDTVGMQRDDAKGHQVDQRSKAGLALALDCVALRTADGLLLLPNHFAAQVEIYEHADLR
jgi:hypothetical protein